ncbi:MAG: ABC transporter ATP-binding protein [Xanthobacteraceae bacterium]
MTLLKAVQITKVWEGARGLSVKALDNVSVEADNGAFVAILGPSGCGKSTLLEIIAGLEPATTGDVRMDGRTVTEASPERCMVFQDLCLFPWLSVFDNVAFGLKRRGIARPELKERVDEVLGRVGLSRFAKHFRHQLSGGMKQRVAIARALVQKPRLLLMDEPFAALDFQTRVLMQRFLLEIWESFGTTIMFVTHHIDEAILLADTVYVMSAGPGRIVDRIDIELQRPRSYTTDTFNQYRVALTEQMEREVMRAYQPLAAAE